MIFGCGLETRKMQEQVFLGNNLFILIPICQGGRVRDGVVLQKISSFEI